MSWLIAPFTVRLNQTNIFSFEERLQKRKSLCKSTPKSVKDLKDIHFGSKTKQLFKKANLTYKFASEMSQRHPIKSREIFFDGDHVNSFWKDNGNRQFDCISGSFGHNDDAQRNVSFLSKSKHASASLPRYALSVAHPPLVATIDQARTRASSPWLPPSHTKISWLSLARVAPLEPSQTLTDSPDWQWFWRAHAKRPWLSPAHTTTPEQPRPSQGSHKLPPTDYTALLLSGVVPIPSLCSHLVTHAQRAACPLSTRKSPHGIPNCKAPPPSRPARSKDGTSLECQTNPSQDLKIFASDLILYNFWKARCAKEERNNAASKQIQITFDFESPRHPRKYPFRKASWLPISSFQEQQFRFK